MGKLKAPAAPTHDVLAKRPSNCPQCGHDAGLAAPEFSLVRKLLGMRPKPYTCAHVEVEQDALVDTAERCACSTSWHIS